MTTQKAPALPEAKLPAARESYALAQRSRPLACCAPQSWFERRVASFVITRERSSLERLRSFRCLQRERTGEREHAAPFSPRRLASLVFQPSRTQSRSKERVALFRDDERASLSRTTSAQSHPMPVGQPATGRTERGGRFREGGRCKHATIGSARSEFAGRRYASSESGRTRSVRSHRKSVICSVMKDAYGVFQITPDLKRSREQSSRAAHQKREALLRTPGAFWGCSDVVQFASARAI